MIVILKWQWSRNKHSWTADALKIGMSINIYLLFQKTSFSSDIFLVTRFIDMLKKFFYFQIIIVS